MFFKYEHLSSFHQKVTSLHLTIYMVSVTFACRKSAVTGILTAGEAETNALHVAVWEARVELLAVILPKVTMVMVNGCTIRSIPISYSNV